MTADPLCGVQCHAVIETAPPSTGIIAPVMWDAGESMNAAAQPNSSGSPFLHNGMLRQAEPYRDVG